MVTHLEARYVILKIQHYVFLLIKYLKLNGICCVIYSLRFISSHVNRNQKFFLRCTVILF